VAYCNVDSGSEWGQSITVSKVTTNEKVMFNFTSSLITKCHKHQIYKTTTIGDRMKKE